MSIPFGGDRKTHVNRDGRTTVLVVARAKGTGLSPFVEEQMTALAGLGGISVEALPVHGKAPLAYLSLLWRLRQRLASNDIDIVHAHFGITGLATTIQQSVPTVITFHGSDINRQRLRPISRLAASRAAATIVVAQGLADIAGFRYPPHVIPCGVDKAMFFPEDYEASRRALGFGAEPVIVFGSSRDRWVKNYPLAEAAVALAGPATLIELKGFSRPEVRQLLSAADVLLMTSRSEGSPQVVKEALLTGCPVVSTDVGDVAALIGDVPGCHVTAADPAALAHALRLVARARTRVPAIPALERLSAESVARRVARVYEVVLSRRVPGSNVDAGPDSDNGHERLSYALREG